MMNQPITAVPLVFLDVETTGLKLRDGHRICEVALLRVCGRVVEDRYTTLVDPLRPLDPRAAAVNGISTDMLRDAPIFDDIADQVVALLSGAVLVAHNADFDMGFLSGEFQFLGRSLPSLPVIDTLTLARQLLPGYVSHSLPSLSRVLRLPTPSHRAMSDVLALQGLFCHLVGLLSDRGVTTLGEVLRFQRGLRPGDPEPVAPPNGGTGNP